jgi:hypothetical protein
MGCKRITRIKAKRQLVVVVLPAVRFELALVIGAVKAGSGERPRPKTSAFD